MNNTKNFDCRILEILETMPLVEGIEYLLSLPRKNRFSRKHVLAELCATNTKCACCGVEGTKFMLGKATDGSLHWNLYTDNDIAFSLYHILPKVHVGFNHIDNMQLLCVRCNRFKSDKPYKIEIFKKLLDAGLDVQIVSLNSIRIGKGDKMPVGLFVELSQHLKEYKDDMRLYYSFNELYFIKTDRNK